MILSLAIVDILIFYTVSVSSQIIPQQIGFQNQIQISNNNTQQQISQQQMLQQQHGNNQGQMQQISFEILKPSTSGQITLYPMPQIQPQPLHTSLIDNQMYNSDNVSTSNISSTQETIYQRLESLKVELENKDYFQSSCDELNNYLQNENLYNSYQEMLVQCLRVRVRIYNINESIKLILNSLYILLECKKQSFVWF